MPGARVIIKSDVTWISAVGAALSLVAVLVGVAFNALW